MYLPTQNLPLKLDTPQYSQLLVFAAAIGERIPHTELRADGSHITRYVDRLPVEYRQAA